MQPLEKKKKSNRKSSASVKNFGFIYQMPLWPYEDK